MSMQCEGAFRRDQKDRDGDNYCWLVIFAGDCIMCISRLAWILTLFLGLSLMPTILIAEPARVPWHFGG